MGLRGPKARPLWERFEEKVVPGNRGCVVWTGSTNGVGYGILVVSPGDGSHRKLYAHRLAYERKNGPIPDGLHLDHLCRNTLCVNPDHLEPVTAGENVLRGIGFCAINARKTHCPYGHPYSGSNLSFNKSSGSRICRTCRRIYDAKRRPRRRTRKAA